MRQQEADERRKKIRKTKLGQIRRETMWGEISLKRKAGKIQR